MKISRFRFGDWLVDRDSCVLALDGGGSQIQIEPRAMDVLAALCSHAGSILSAEDLLRLCWDGLNVGETQVHKAIAQLRRAFGDSAYQPRYIENIRKRGYRTIAPVVPLDQDAAQSIAGSWSQGSPYVGLDPFDAEHARLFFGREASVERLTELVTAQIAAGRALILVLGPSGSGKTSLVQAGLLPALANAGGTFAVIASTSLDLGDIGEAAPLTAIGGALLDLESDDQPVLSGQHAEGVGASLAEDDGTALALLRQAADRQPGGRFVLFVDRLEALFNESAVTLAERKRFLRGLDHLADSDAVIVIAACRNDYYPNIAAEAVLMRGKESGAHFDVAPPSRTEIAQMIQMPALAAGLSFGIDPVSKENLADLLSEDAADSPDALPLLQYTLQELYFQRSPSRELTLAAYRALGGIEGAIGKRAEAALTSLPAASQAALLRILPLIVRIGAEDGLVQSRRAAWSALGSEEERDLVRSLVEQRLFVSLAYDGQSVFGVAHEALLRQWPRVVAWIAEHRQALRSRSRLEAAAQQWQAEGRRRDLLLPRGKQLEEARELAERPQFQLSAEIRALIAASLRRRRLGDFARMGALGGFAALGMVAIVLGLRASHAESIATQRRLEAEDLMNYMVGSFVDKLRPLGRLDLLDAPAQKALSYLTGEDIGSLPNSARLQQAKALQTLAEVSRSRGKPDAAIQALDQADKLLQANLAKGPVDLELLKTLGAVSFWLGQIARDQGRLEDAERKFSQYRDYAERMNKIAPDDVAAWLALASALESLGSLAHLSENEESAAANFAAAIELRRRALQKNPTSLSKQKDLANSLSFLANAKSALGDLPAALELLNQQMVLLEGLHEAEPNSLIWSRSLYFADRKVGDILAAQGRTDEALEILRKGLKLIEDNIAVEPSNKLWVRGRIGLSLDIILTTLSKKNSVATSVDIEKFKNDYEEILIADQKEEDVVIIYALLYYTKSMTLMLMEKFEDAEDAVIKSESIIEKKREERHANKFININYSKTLILMSQILDKLHREEEAKQACKLSIDSLSGIAASSKDFQVIDPWIRANLCYGNRKEVANNIAYLEKIGYKKPDYLSFIKKTME